MLRRLVHRFMSRRSGPPPARPTAPTSAAPAGTSAIQMGEPLAPPHAVAPERDDAWWQARLDEALVTWRDVALTIPASPDSLELVEMLAQGSESVIRQLPSAALDSISLCDDSSLSIAQLSGRLGRDPSLTLALLRTANSAALGAGRQPVLGVDGALERIGLVAGRAVVLANCVEGLLSRPGGRYDAMASNVWSHMIRTAAVARMVAASFRADDDEAFSVSLLHDAGKLIVFDHISALRVKRRRTVVLPRTFLGTLLQALHEPLGALAALRWNMGPRAALAIGEHHRNGPASPPNPLAEVVFTAERIDHASRRGDVLDLDVVFSAGRLSGSAFKVAGALRDAASSVAMVAC